VPPQRGQATEAHDKARAAGTHQIERGRTPMTRKSLWKDFYIIDMNEFSALQSYYESSKAAWSKWTTVFGRGAGVIETNLPYSELRLWFRYALDKPVPDHVSSKKPSWELYNDET
jgi:hypothetical protein